MGDRRHVLAARDAMFPVSALGHDVDAARAADSLTELEAAVLAFEAGGWWKFAGAKEQAIRDRLGCSATRYYQLLNALLSVGAAQREYPQMVARLRRVRGVRLQQRSTRYREGLA